MNTASKTRHVFILFLADIVWGIAFVAQSKGGDAVGAFSFNGIRFLIGALCLLPVIKILDMKELTVNRPESKKQKKELWIAGSCCGIALFFASNLQQLGISMGAESGKAGFLTATYILMVPILGIFLKRKCGVKIWIGVFIALDMKELTVNRPESKKQKKELWIAGSCCGIALFFASNLQQLGISMGAESGKAGFLTATYILMVPILGIFLKRKCGVKIWIGVFIALIGMYFLCMNGTFSLSGSDLLLLAGALCFAIQILVIDHFVSQVDAVRLSCIEFFVTGLGSCIVMIFTDMGPSAGGIAQWAQSLCTWDAWIPILYAGIFSSGVGYTLQIVGQKGLNPAVASVAMSLESVVSVIAGWILLDQMLGGREIFGCVLMFIAIIIAQLPDREYTK